LQFAFLKSRELETKDTYSREAW